MSYHELISSTIVPAEPGHSVAKFWPAQKGDDIDPSWDAHFDYTPIVAWQIILTKCEDGISRYTHPVTFDNSFADGIDSLVDREFLIRLPSGKFDGEYSFNSEAEALKLYIRQEEYRAKQKAERDENRNAA